MTPGLPGVLHEKEEGIGCCVVHNGFANPLDALAN